MPPLAPRTSHVSSARTAGHGRVHPSRLCSRPADTTHPYVALSRLKRTRTRTRCDSIPLPVAGLGHANDGVTPTLGPYPADGEHLDLRGPGQRFWSFDRGRRRHWRIARILLAVGQPYQPDATHGFAGSFHAMTATRHVSAWLAVLTVVAESIGSVGLRRRFRRVAPLGWLSLSR